MADVFGTDQAEVLNGEDGVTEFADAVFGFGGDDWLSGLAGDDVLYGGAGADLLIGGSGVDFANYNTSPTIVVASLAAGVGTQGDAEGDTFLSIENIDGSRFTDVLWGDGNENVLQGRGGDDDLLGQGGDDLLEGGPGEDILFGATGNDTIMGADGSDSLSGAAGVDILSGGSGDDVFGFVGDDDVLPGEIIDGGTGFDRIIVGTDTVGVVASNVTFANAASIGGIESIALRRSSTATFTASQVKTGFSDIIGPSFIGTVETFGIEMGAETSIDVSSFSFMRWDATDRFFIVGDSDNESITGSTQIDRLIGNAGDDLLVGNAGVDELFGGPGNDDYHVDQASGEATELAGQGNDSVLAFVSHSLSANVENLTLFGTGSINGTGNTLANTIIGNSGDNILNGAAGVDSLQGLGGNDSYFVDSAADTIAETTGIDNVNASVSYTLAAGVAVETLRTTNAAGTAAINLTGNNLANIVTGNAGANNLNGGGGIDTMQGLAGNDIYVVDNVADKAIEAVSAGTDRVNSAVSFTLGANVENLTLTGAAAISGAGNTLANIIIGNNANNTLSGGAGIDSLRGGLGNDSYIVDHVSDQVVESAGAGTDRIVSSVTEVLALNVENLTLSGIAAINGTGNTLNNVIIGNAANNILAGSSGIDSLSGSTGNDVLIGGGHRDIMTGGAGLDDFDFNVVAEMGKTATTRDVITDFTLGDDIDLSTIDANGALAGHTFSFLATKGAVFTGAAGQLRWFQSGTTTIVEGTVNADKVADFQIQLTGLKTLTAADFIL